MNLVLWAIAGAAVLHAAEEYLGGFIEYVSKAAGSKITIAEFLIVNVLLVSLCAAGATARRESIVFVLSAPGLVFVNSWIHIVAALKTRAYAPGLSTALLLYLPLSAAAFFVAFRDGVVTPLQALSAVALGGLWHLIPFALYLTRQPLAKSTRGRL